jgi:hypothetical protein
MAKTTFGVTYGVTKADGIHAVRADGNNSHRIIIERVRHGGLARHGDLANLKATTLF